MIKNIWNLKARIYKNRSKFFFGKILSKENIVIKEMLGNRNFCNKSILDLGAGLGNASSLIDDKEGVLFFALDSSRLMLRENICSNPNQLPILASAENVPVKSSCIDCLLIIGLMEYMKNKNICLNEANRVLKSGGIAVITFSPRNIFTFGRLLWGNMLYPTSAAKEMELLSEKFIILEKRKTLMQRQYMIKKP